LDFLRLRTELPLLLLPIPTQLVFVADDDVDDDGSDDKTIDELFFKSFDC